METNLSRGDDGRALAEKLINLYYTTVPYPWTRHQIDSYDQFLSADIPAIIRSSNPMILLEDQIANTGEYSYKAEIFIGGLNGDAIFIGTPTVSLNKTEDVRIMLPNEARLRNLNLERHGKNSFDRISIFLILQLKLIFLLNTRNRADQEQESNMEGWRLLTVH